MADSRQTKCVIFCQRQRVSQCSIVLFSKHYYAMFCSENFHVYDHILQNHILSCVYIDKVCTQKWGGVKTERVFPGLSVLRKNNKMEVLSPEKWKHYPRKNKNKKR
jgi:hypothetical protein